jgi:hypothetical protein
MSPTSNAEERQAPTAAIDVRANGSRRSLEALYLELRELAKQHGLQIEYQLTRDDSGEPANR